MTSPLKPATTQIFQFILELEKLKAVKRKTKTLSEDRYENSAEHSWQVALLALSLAPYAHTPINIEQVVKMLLLHDIVEIDTGDKIVYSTAHNDYENELKAAKRIFCLLPDTLGATYLALWLEFAAKKTSEAKFANAIDRLMPVLKNLSNQGQSWVENNIKLEQVLSRNAVIADIHPELWELIQEQLQDAALQGYLR